MKSYSITLEENEVIIVSEALARMPYVQVAKLIANLQKQIVSQQEKTE